MRAVLAAIVVFSTVLVPSAPAGSREPNTTSIVFYSDSNFFRIEDNVNLDFGRFGVLCDIGQRFL